MTYKQAIEYLESFIDYEKLNNYAYNKAFGLGRIKALLVALGSPQDELRCIHVAGTKGKGSTCAFIAYILREAGYKAGLYTSPHLEDFRERIRVLNPKSQIPNPKQIPISKFQISKHHDFEGMISRKDLARLVEKITAITATISTPEVGWEVGWNESTPTFFEIYTALAFLYFKEKDVDFVVLETGLGGRLDATNVVDALVNVITPISLEHTQFLGNTLKDITREKAAIIKNRPSSIPFGEASLRCALPFGEASLCSALPFGEASLCSALPFGEASLRFALVLHPSVVITAPQEKEVLDVIKNRCEAIGAKLYQPKIDKGLNPQLLGRHQLINASVAKAAVEALELKIKPDVVKQGIRNTVWPGRCEVMSRKPLIVLDGAQNIASAKAIKKAVRENFRYKRLILVFGVSCDKDIAGICKEFAAVGDRIIITKSSNPRAASPEEILANLTNRSHRTNLTNCVEDAMALALKLAKKEDLILVAGSLFVVGEARGIFLKSPWYNKG